MKKTPNTNSEEAKNNENKNLFLFYKQLTKRLHWGLSFYFILSLFELLGGESYKNKMSDR